MTQTPRTADGAADDPLARLEAAAEERRAAAERLEAADADALREVRNARERLLSLFAEYEERATGDGDFEAFIRFQEAIEEFVEDLPEDLPDRETFEEIDDTLQRRRLREKEFDKCRRLLADLDSTLAPLDEHEQARTEYADARENVERALRDVQKTIDDLQRLVSLAATDLDAPVERLREPIERYDEAVSEAFAEFKRSASAREVLSFVQATSAFPLVPYREPPADLRSYVESNDAGEETIQRLLDLADYSPSKLDHYVDDAMELKRNVATQETYLRRLDAEPLTVGWPPPDAATLRWQADERIRVVDRFAPGEVVSALRDVRALTRREDYDRLRESAVARAELSERERERVANEDVAAQLERARERRERLEDALAEYPSL